MGISTYLNPVSDGIPKGFRFPNFDEDFDYGISPENDIFINNFAKYLENSQFIFDKNEDSEYTSVILNKEKLFKIASILISQINENINLLPGIAPNYYILELFGLIEEIKQLMNYCETNPEFQICWSY
jgi:hypothetical protein